MKQVAPEFIRGDLWEWVRAGLKDVAGRVPAHYEAEDVLLLLRSRSAMLWVVEGTGFMVTQQSLDPDGPVLHVFAIWCEPGKFAPIKEQLYAGLIAFAKSFQAKRIRNQSSRRWEAEPFWKIAATVFEHEIDYSEPT